MFYFFVCYCCVILGNYFFIVKRRCGCAAYVLTECCEFKDIPVFSFYIVKRV